MAFFYNVTLNVNIEFLKIAISEPILSTEQAWLWSLEIRIERIFNNLIKQNQQLGSDSILQQSTIVSRVQRLESSVQNPASRVQRPTLAFRVQELRYAVSYRQWNLNLNIQISTREYDVASLKWENKNYQQKLNYQLSTNRRKLPIINQQTKVLL